jgi:hypothetical protein
MSTSLSRPFVFGCLGLLVSIVWRLSSCSRSQREPPASTSSSATIESPLVSPVTERQLQPSDREQVSAELRRIGDDGLTLRFAELLAAQLDAVGLPVVSKGQTRTPRILIVAIPSHLAWSNVGARVRVSYSLQFTGPLGEVLGESDGTCWEDELVRCAADAVVDAQAAASKLRAPA